MARDGWREHLIPVRPEDFPQRPDDPRLGSIIEYNVNAALTPGRPVIIGFPQDEGVRRNGGRVGAAKAPARIRHWLARLTPWYSTFKTDLSDAPAADLGDIAVSADLEMTQAALGEVVGGVLNAGAVPIVLGGGHETAFGHYLGYVQAATPVGIINIDAHLDVRPTLDGKGHSGSPFRQALEHSPKLRQYVCLGVQPQSVSREHWDYAKKRRCRIEPIVEVEGMLAYRTVANIKWLRGKRLPVFLTLDADAVDVASMPGVSAPNPAGFMSRDVLQAVFDAGHEPDVSSFELVEINPQWDVDERSSRWGALAVWHFLHGLASRGSGGKQ